MGRDRRTAALTAGAVAGLVVTALGGAGCQKDAAAPADAGDVDTGDEDVGEETDAQPDWAPPVCPAASGDVANAPCNDQLPAGPCVARIQIDDSAPAPAGGALVAGNYDLVESLAYTSPGGATGPIGEPRQETIALSGSGTDFTISSAALVATTTTRRTSAAVASGPARMTLTATCPAPVGDPSDGGAGAEPPTVYYFTATDTSLTLFRIGPTGPVQADSYARR